MKFRLTFFWALCVLQCVHCIPVPQSGEENEQQLMNKLKDDYNLSDEDEQVFEELISDEEGKTDHENDNVPFRVHVMQVLEKFKVLSDEELDRVKTMFITRIGEEATQKIFDEAYRIYMNEQAELEDLEEELWVDKAEAEAFETVVKDVETGADPMEEDEKSQYGIEELATDVMSLPPDLQQRFRALLIDRFGEEQARILLDEINEIKNNVDSKIDNEWQDKNLTQLDPEEEDIEEGKTFWHNLGAKVPEYLLEEDPWPDEAAEEAIDDEEEDEYQKTNQFFRKLGVNVSDDEDSFWDDDDDYDYDYEDAGEELTDGWGGEKEIGKENGDVDGNTGAGEQGADKGADVETGDEQAADAVAPGADQATDGVPPGEQVVDDVSGGADQATDGVPPGQQVADDVSEGTEQAADAVPPEAGQATDGVPPGEQVTDDVSGGADQATDGVPPGEQVTDDVSGGADQATDGVPPGEQVTDDVSSGADQATDGVPPGEQVTDDVAPGADQATDGVPPGEQVTDDVSSGADQATDGVPPGEQVTDDVAPGADQATDGVPPGEQVADDVSEGPDQATDGVPPEQVADDVSGGADQAADGVSGGVDQVSAPAAVPNANNQSTINTSDSTDEFPANVPSAVDDDDTAAVPPPVSTNISSTESPSVDMGNSQNGGTNLTTAATVPANATTGNRVEEDSVSAANVTIGADQATDGVPPGEQVADDVSREDQATDGMSEVDQVPAPIAVSNVNNQSTVNISGSTDEFPANVPSAVNDDTSTVLLPVSNNTSSTESPSVDTGNSQNGGTNLTTAAIVPTNATTGNRVEEDGVSAANVTIGTGNQAGNQGNENDLYDWANLDDDEYSNGDYGTTVNPWFL